MKLLLDTVTIIRITMDESMLSKAAVNAYRDPFNTLFVSVVSLWGIMVKNKLGKLPLPLPLSELLAPLKSATGLRILPLKESATYHLGKIPDLHNDPFDRMLICQALDED